MASVPPPAHLFRQIPRHSPGPDLAYRQPTNPCVDARSLQELQPPFSGMTPYTRIAVLEQELEYCKVEKATAELAVQYLAGLGAKGNVCGNDPDEQVKRLTEDLARAHDEKEKLRAQLENTQNILITLISSGNLAHLRRAPPHDQGNPQTANFVDSVDLIDLVDSSKKSNTGGVSEDDVTLLDTSCDASAHYEGILPKERAIEETNGSGSSTSPEFTYIHHFVSKAEQAGAQNGGNSMVPAQAAPSPKSHGSTVSSFDQGSEASVEPRSEPSSRGHSLSTDEPTTSLESFATAPSRWADEPWSPDRNVSEQTSHTTECHLQRHDLTNQLPDRSVGSSYKLGRNVEKKKHCNSKTKPSDFAYARSSLNVSLISRGGEHSDRVARHQDEDGRGRGHLPDFFKYGIRFEPFDGERDTFRTILISRIPVDTILHQVLERVRGGAVADAKLLNTTSITGSNSALIIFLHDQAALGFEDYANHHPITINNQEISVKSVATPTWPLDPGIMRAISDHHHTRCLEIRSFPRQRISVSKLRGDLRIHPAMIGDRVEYMNMRPDGVVDLRFSSIDYAGRGYGMLTSFNQYKGCEIRFVVDPCAQPVETLNTKSDELNLQAQCKMADDGQVANYEG